MSDIEVDSGMEDEGIAIIGMAGRFPGAKNIEEFWYNLQNGVDSVVFHSEAELDASGIDPASLRSNPHYVGAGTVLEGADLFDAAFFGFNPREAELMDPQHRVFLESSWEALENAGYDAKTYEGAIGVYAGAGANTYLLSNIYPNHALRDMFGLPVLIGNGTDFLPTRVSYKLDLKGPSVNVQTACSTSLVAICTACQSLLNYQCDMALAGGVAIAFPQTTGYLYQEGGILSADGHCRAFDAKATGMVMGRGVGVVVLKRLADARADGDNIYAVIKGSATNNDGSLKVGYTAPSVDGQAEVIAMAQALAGVDAGTISYIEAHGTGTPLGDPIEIAGLTQAFRNSTSANNFCAIGSVKTNIGHLDIAAGVSGLIKTALALKHKKLPPSLHFEEPNPKIDFANSPFYVNTELRDWQPGKTPRRAGVSSFGIGGTNAHAVLEEAPLDDTSSPSRAWQILTLSARSADALDAATANLAQHLKNNSGLNLADAAYTLHVGRRTFKHRRMLVCKDAEEAISVLESGDAQRLTTQVAQRDDAPIVFMFPGQGAQFVNMGRDLYESEPVFKQHVDHCAKFLQPHLNVDLRNILYPPIEKTEQMREQLNQTSITQPALFVIEYALSKLWMEWGITPQAMIGHSIGEYVAACLAGVFSLEDALTLVAARGRLMQAQPTGAMLAVRVPEQEIQSLLGSNLALAAVNGAALCVVSGPFEAVDELQQKLTAREIVHRRLHTSHAFHSAMMDPILDAFKKQLKNIELHAPQIPFISNVSAIWITADEATDANYWVKHLRQTVRFAAGLQTLFEEKERIFLEVGPGQTLTTLARQHPSRAKDQTVIPSSHGVQEQESDVASLLNAAGRLWLAGTQIRWPEFYANERRRRVALPTYPFERKRFWMEAPREERKPIQNDGYEDSNKSASAIQIEDSIVMNNNEKEIIVTEQQISVSTVSREERLLPMLTGVLSDLSGMDLTSIEPSTSFFEMGFDSLFLTQVSQAMQKKFGIKITFRQLLQESPTPATLAAFIDQKLPPEAFQEVAPQPEPAFAVPALEKNTSVLSTPQTPSLEPTLQALMTRLGQQPPSPQAPVQSSDAGVLERIMTQQLSIMAQQLEELRNTRAPAAMTPAAQTTQSQVAPVAVQPHITSPLTHAVETSKPEVKAFGPYKPIQKGSTSGLTEQQQQHITGLIERYTRRTAGSKRLTQQHRPHLSDPRAVAGFRQLWKEMVYPIVSERTEGSKIYDVDGNEYVDVTMGFGTNLFGHSPPFVTKAIQKQLKLGIDFGPTSPLAGKVAALMCEFTGMDRAIFCNTGSEAVTAALRAARTVSGRDKIALFAGSYHGIFDEVLVRAKTVNGKTQPAPIAPGIPEHMTQDVIVLDYGTPEALDILKTRGHEIAALVVEPVQSRRPDFQPKEFLHEVRKITQESGTALVFDEVITGFRTHPGGAQAWYGVQADLATYGKVIGGGLPIGVLTGKAEYMDVFDGGMWNYGDDSFPEVGVTFFAGTFVRHPLALAAAWAVLNHLKESGPQLQENLNKKTAEFVGTLNSFFQKNQAPVHLTHYSSFFYVNYDGDPQFAGLLAFHMREKGIHIWDGRPCFLSTAHTDNDLATIIKAFKESVAELQAGGIFPDPDGTKKKISAPEQSASSSKNPVAAPAPAKTNAMANESSSVTSGAHGNIKNFTAPVSLPLTEAQRELWMSVQMNEDASCSYNDSLSLRLRGVLDAAALRKALQELVNRHDAFRTTFDLTGDYQKISPAITLEVPLTDFSSSDSSRRESMVIKIITEEVEKKFNLEQAPLLRARLLKLDEHSHILLLTVHHIACDGWSFGVLLHELGEIYASMCQGIPHTLNTPMQFSEYVDWQTREQQSSESQVAETYWVNQFSGPAPVLDLPTDRPRPPVKSYHGALKVVSVGNPLYAELQRLGKQQSSTMFTVLLAAFEVWLYRLTNQTDIVVGIPAAGQALVGGHDLVGHCVNFLPLRKQLDKDQKFTDFLRAIQDTVLDAYDHQNYTFGSLVQKLNLPRDPSRTPLVSVTFNVDRMKGKLNFSDLDVDVITNPKSFVNFDIKLNVIETDDELKLEWYYNTDLFDEASIVRLMSHYETLLVGIVADPSQRIVDLPLLNQAERHQLLTEWNDTVTDYPKDASIHSLFEAQVERDPNAIALVFENSTLSYRKLNARANQLARHLRQLGVVPGVPVALCVERSAEMIVAVLGILKAGGAYVPLDPGYPCARLNYLLEDTQTPLILTQAQFTGALPLHPHIVCLEDIDLSAQSTENLFNETAELSAAQSLAYIMYTSGSTGQPKGVSVTHRGVVRLVKETHYASFNADEVFLQFAPLAFDASTFEIWGSLLNGARLVIFPAYLPSLEDLGQVLQRERVTTLWLTAGLFHQMVDERIQDLGHVRQLLAGGDVLSVAHVRKVLETLPGCTLINGYGPTESTTFSCCYPMRAPLTIGATVPIGRPISNTQVYILDSELQPVPVGVAGEIYISGDGLALGYLNHDELTAEKFITHPFNDVAGARLYRSGDLARYLSDGNIEFLGRRDHQVKIRGFRIELGEIESVLAAYPGVRESTVLAREDVPGEKRLAAYIVTRSGEDPDLSELRGFVKQKLPDYMVPAAFIFLPALPLTANGKIDRQALPAPDQNEASSKHVAPRDSLEFQLAQLWEKTLSRQHIGIKDDFFESGGHSLSAVRLVAQIKKSFGIALTLSSLFQAPTIEQLAALLRENGWSKPDWSALVAIQPTGSKPPFFCLPGGGGNLFGMRQLARHMGEDQPFYGLQPSALVAGAALTRVEDMAAHYLKEMRTLQPEGPYYLGGGCFGGLVAFEIAQQLHAEGQEVALLVLMDTPSSPDVNDDAETKLSIHRENLTLLSLPGKAKYLFERANRKLTLGSKKLACNLFLKMGRLPAVLREQYVFDTDARAQKLYVAQPYHGRITMLWASQDIENRYHDSHRRAWSRLALGGAESYNLPCDHIGIFREPQVRILADRLKGCIDIASASVLKQQAQQVARTDLSPRLSLVS